VRAVPSRRWLSVLLGLGILAGAAFILAVPPWQSPDEPTHLEYAQALAAGGPLAPDPGRQFEILASLDRHDFWRLVGEEPPRPLPPDFFHAPFLSAAPSQFAKNQPVVYLPAAAVLFLLPSSSPESGLYLWRALSLLFTLGAGLLTVLAARFYLPGRAAPWAAGVLVVFLPQMLLIGTSASPDSLLVLLGAAWFWALSAARFRPSPSRVPLLLVLGVVGAASGYRFLAVLLPGLLFLLWPGRGRRVWFPVGLLFLLAALYTATAWFRPEFLHPPVSRLARFWQAVAGTISGRTGFPGGYGTWFSREVFESFWLKFGWMRYSLPPSWYRFYQTLCLVAAAGLTAGFLAGRLRRMLLPLLLGGGALAALYLAWGGTPKDTSPQGRYLFVTLAPLAVLFLTGILNLFPRRRVAAVSLLLSALWLGLAAGAFLRYIIPAFHG